MGFWDNVLKSAVGAVMSPRVTWYGLNDPNGLASALAESINGMSPAEMYRSQPHLRTVISFLGRNVAQLGIHVFEPVGENDRKRRRDARSAVVLGRPNPTMTAYQLKYALTVDKGLYDWAYLLPVTGPDGDDQLWRIPPAWVDPIPQGPFEAPKYRIHPQEAGSLPQGFGSGPFELREDQLIVFKGYDPASTWKGSAPISALKNTLIEQIESSRYRMQVWKRGGRVSSVLERPKDAPVWTETQANRFREDWYANWTGSGPKAGGTPILEDGMTLKRVDFTAKEQEWAEGTRLALATVAGAYHISPAMVGSMDAATYNNVKEYRKMLFGDSLGPTLVELQDVLNQYLLPRYGEQALYAEFNIWAKLAGSFEEQAAFLQAAVGAPYMVRNEARARLNLPAIEGGDELITPLNVLVGSMANPQDSAPDPADPPTPGEELAGQAEVKRPQIEVKATLADRDYVVKYRASMEAFFARQGRVVMSKLGAKADWWDDTRWFRELRDELLKLHITITQDAAVEALKAAGIDPTEYDPARTVAYLTERAKRDSESINKSTKRKIQEALREDEDLDVLFAGLVAGAAVLAQSMATGSLNWGKLESGRQTRAGSKTWVVTSKNPRSSHAALNGQTVPLESTFSNGLRWPGDPGGSVDEVAGCTCQVNVVY